MRRAHWLRMARYSIFVGKRVEVCYKAGGNQLPATGMLVADSGRSVFLEEQFRQSTGVKRFRWEIPYQCIVRLNEHSVPTSVD